MAAPQGARPPARPPGARRKSCTAREALCMQGCPANAAGKGGRSLSEAPALQQTPHARAETVARPWVPRCPR